MLGPLHGEQRLYDAEKRLAILLCSAYPLTALEDTLKETGEQKMCRLVSGLLQWRGGDVFLFAAIGRCVVKAVAARQGDKKMVDALLLRVQVQFCAQARKAMATLDTKELFSLFLSATDKQVCVARCTDSSGCESKSLKFALKGSKQESLLFCSVDFEAVISSVNAVGRHLVMASSLFRAGKWVFSLPAAKHLLPRDDSRAKVARAVLLDVILKQLRVVLTDALETGRGSDDVVPRSREQHLINRIFRSFCSAEAAYHTRQYLDAVLPAVLREQQLFTRGLRVSSLGSPMQFDQTFLPPCMAKAFKTLQNGDRWPRVQNASRFALGIYFTQLGVSREQLAALWKDLFDRPSVDRATLRKWVSEARGLHQVSDAPKYPQAGCGSLLGKTTEGSVVRCPFSGSCADADVEDMLAPYNLTPENVEEVVALSRNKMRKAACAKVFNDHCFNAHGVFEPTASFSTRVEFEEVGLKPSAWTLTYARMMDSFQSDFAET